MLVAEFAVTGLGIAFEHHEALHRIAREHGKEKIESGIVENPAIDMTKNADVMTPPTNLIFTAPLELARLT